jgi:hypothetical protein
MAKDNFQAGHSNTAGQCIHCAAPDRSAPSHREKEARIDQQASDGCNMLVPEYTFPIHHF